MIVKCTLNSINAISDNAVKNYLRDYIKNDDAPLDELKIGHKYSVEAIELRGNYWWFYIHSIKEINCPTPYPAEYFKIIDNSLPAHWSIRMECEKGHSLIKFISFPEWVNDSTFYERLVEDDPECVKIYHDQLNFSEKLKDMINKVL